MRWVLVTSGAILALLGTVWMLQGLNVLPGSFMTGQAFWAGAGLVALLVGLGLLVTGLRRPAAGRRDGGGADHKGSRRLPESVHGTTAWS